MSALIHTLRAVLVGVWLGGVVFTTAVVSPTLNTMKWGEAERVGCGPRDRAPVRARGEPRHRRLGALPGRERQGLHLLLRRGLARHARARRGARDVEQVLYR